MYPLKENNMRRVQLMLFFTLAFAFIAPCSVVQAKDAKTDIDDSARCTTFLPGSWSGEGTVEGFGPSRKVSSAATYERDGTFTSTTRYLGDDNEWTEQTTTGSWSAERARSSKICSLTLKSTSEFGSATGTSEFTIIDNDTYRTFGLDLKRVQ